ncbi:MAG: nucleoside hydrolase [SAR324 cluster bacterium]|nr:nucleoside hydrolase [SAR324 cluster bacterium]MBL7035089.1 nucleoside hydrolase [SAR324 cluster bacterium]
MIKLLLDVDTGIDDALALFYLAQAQKQGQLEILGSTTVGGNVEVAQTTLNTLKIWEMLELDIPVAAGANNPLLVPLSPAPFVHGDDGLGNSFLSPPKKMRAEESAAEMILRLSRQYSGELTVLTTAPLTNIAVALLQDPSLAQRIKKLVLMGGAVFTGNVSAVAEANIANDPEAARIVFRSGIEMTMIGLDVTHEVYWEERDLEPLIKIDNQRSAFLLQIIRFISAAYESLSGWRRIVLHDPLAAGVCLFPDLVKTEKRYVDVELNGDLTRGMTVVDRRGRTPLGEENMEVALEVDAERFKTQLMQSLLVWIQEG